MTRVLKVLVLLAALIAAGCSQTPPPVVTVASDAPPPDIAPVHEPDPAWAEHADADATLRSSVTNYRDNKQRFRDLVAARRVCRASLIAQGLAPPAMPASR